MLKSQLEMKMKPQMMFGPTFLRGHVRMLDYRGSEPSPFGLWKNDSEVLQIQ